MFVLINDLLPPFLKVFITHPYKLKALDIDLMMIFSSIHDNEKSPFIRKEVKKKHVISYPYQSKG